MALSKLKKQLGKQPLTQWKELLETAEALIAASSSPTAVKHLALRGVAVLIRAESVVMNIALRQSDFFQRSPT